MEEGVVRTEEAETEYNRQLTSLLRPFAPFSHDMYGILSKSKTLEEGEQGAAAARESARDDGYRMLLCPKNNPYSGSNKKQKQKRGGNMETEAEFEMWVNSLGRTCALPMSSKSLGKRKRGGTKKRNKRKNKKKTKKRALKKRHRKSKKARKFRKGKKRTHRKKY